MSKHKRIWRGCSVDYKYNKHNRCKRAAHSKGVLFFDKYSGILISHSIPRYPNKGPKYSGFPEGELKYGQSILAISLSTDEFPGLICASI